MKVTVTGAAGFIGTPVVTLLKERGHAVTPLADPLRLREPSSPATDVVIHLAASRRHIPSPADATGDIAAMDAVLEYCRRFGAACVFASTAGVYGSLGGPAVSEDSDVDPQNPYAAGKLAAEQRCRREVVASGLSCTILRMFNVYGPGQRPPFLVADVIAALADGKPLTLKMPDAVRDLVYVDDVARAFVAAAESPAGGLRVVNIGSGEGVRVRDLVTLVARVMGTTPTWHAASQPSGEVGWSVANITRAREQLGWTPMVTLEAGVTATYELHRRAISVPSTSDPASGVRGR